MVNYAQWKGSHLRSALAVASGSLTLTLDRGFARLLGKRPDVIPPFFVDSRRGVGRTHGKLLGTDLLRGDNLYE